MTRALVSDDARQSVLDALQGLIGTQDASKILVMSLEAALPRKAQPEEEKAPINAVVATREELYNEVEKNTILGSAYLLLVFLSTVVVAIGLLENNVALAQARPRLFSLTAGLSSVLAGVMVAVALLPPAPF